MVDVLDVKPFRDLADVAKDQMLMEYILQKKEDKSCLLKCRSSAGVNEERGPTVVWLVCILPSKPTPSLDLDVRLKWVHTLMMSLLSDIGSQGKPWTRCCHCTWTPCMGVRICFTLGHKLQCSLSWQQPLYFTAGTAAFAYWMMASVTLSALLPLYC